MALTALSGVDTVRKGANVARTGIRRRALIGTAAAAGVIFALSGPAVATAGSVEGNCLTGAIPTATHTGTSTTDVVVAWSDQCTNVSSYSIERSGDSGTTWSTITTAPTVVSAPGAPNQSGTYTDSSLTACGSYVYRVVAHHTPGNAPEKTSISANSTAVVLTPYDATTETGNSSCTASDSDQPGDCAQLTGAFGLGYYTNKNGQASLTDADFDALTGLHLVDYSGTAKDFSGSLDAKKAALKSWLQGATAKNMSYMLSAQLATLELNILHHAVNPARVICEVDPVLTIGDVVAGSEQYLATPGNSVVLGGALTRPAGDAWETLLDEINSNLVSVGS